WGWASPLSPSPRTCGSASRNCGTRAWRGRSRCRTPCGPRTRRATPTCDPPRTTTTRCGGDRRGRAASSGDEAVDGPAASSGAEVVHRAGDALADRYRGRPAQDLGGACGVQRRAGDVAQSGRRVLGLVRRPRGPGDEGVQLAVARLHAGAHVEPLPRGAGDVRGAAERLHHVVDEHVVAGVAPVAEDPGGLT